MATLAPPSPLHSPTRMPRRWARKVERYCCMGITYFPLVFVYSITTWAIWVEIHLGSEERTSSWVGMGTSTIGFILYALLNWSYTTAVFTSPGTTTVSNDGYDSLPTQAPPVATNFTVKSNGELRFCKKCQARKPDRAHHCSTCGKCVLKMDHHCPWLATCVGLRNYKAFLLFITYTTLFCFVCFAVSADWVYSEVVQDGEITESFMPVHYVMLAVIAGIIGLVLAGFTGWHILLASRGQTTIECLEKTRYLSPLRKAMQHQHIVQHENQGNHDQSYGQQLKDIHTNALPGVTRPEEGEVTVDGMNDRYGGQQSYDALERFRARERYEEYLDEQDSEKLPSAFDLGWRENFNHLFGPRKLLWPFPICTTTGNGWTWEPSPKWLAARERVARDREEQNRREAAAGWGPAPSYDIPEPAGDGAGRHYMVPPTGRPDRSISKADRVLGRGNKADKILGRDAGQYSDGESRRQSTVSMITLRPPRDEDYDTSDDEFERRSTLSRNSSGRWGPTGVVGASGMLRQDSNNEREGGWKKWNDEVDGGVD